jgi:DNA-binding GntR family transcriptional regulator
VFKSLQPKDLVSEVLEEIKTTLIEGKWTPGAKFVEATVAKQFGISRSPIREAARVLVQLGLLTMKPGKGFFVCSPTEQDIRNLYDLRLMLECFSIKKVFEKGEELVLADSLDRTLHKIRQAQKNGNKKKYQCLNLDFHRKICVASGNRHLISSYDSTTDELRFAINVGGTVYDDMGEITKRTENVFNALADRNMEVSIREIASYIEKAVSNVSSSYLAKMNVNVCIAVPYNKI